MPEYTVLTVAAVVVVVALDLVVLRTRLVGTTTFWISLAIMWSFQVVVDGWLTKLSAPIVVYADEHVSGVRLFFDSPIEDFGFGFAVILFTLSVWDVLARRARRRSGSARPTGAAAEADAGTGEVRV